MFWVFVTAVVLYYGIGYWLTAVALRFLKPTVSTRNFVHLYDREKFLFEGQAARQRAVRFWWGGLPIVIGILILSTL